VRIAAGESATVDIYKNDMIVITGGTGAGESALITAYNGTTKDCTVSPALAITCDGTSTYEIIPAVVHAEDLGAGSVTATAIAADAIDADALSADAGTELADALLNRDMAAVTVTNTRSPINALRFLRNKWSISASTLTVTEEDDTTTAWTGTLTTDAAADPVTAVDPA
jgi:energy-coupling factor transporter ATP-binding protein EcfA2